MKMRNSEKVTYSEMGGLLSLNPISDKTLLHKSFAYSNAIMEYNIINYPDEISVGYEFKLNNSIPIYPDLYLGFEDMRLTIELKNVITERDLVNEISGINNLNLKNEFWYVVTNPNVKEWKYKMYLSKKRINPKIRVLFCDGLKLADEVSRYFKLK